MSPNSIIFAVYIIKNYIVFEMSWINTFWVDFEFELSITDACVIHMV